MEISGIGWDNISSVDRRVLNFKFLHIILLVFIFPRKIFLSYNIRPFFIIKLINCSLNTDILNDEFGQRVP